MSQFLFALGGAIACIGLAFAARHKAKPYMKRKDDEK